MTEIREDLQRPRVGDTIVLHGRSGYGPHVLAIEAERAFVLGGPPNEKGSQATWALYLLDAATGPPACSSAAADSPGEDCPRSSA